MKISCITAFYDLNRDKWNYFKRPFEKYFDSFKIIVELYKDTKISLIVFIDIKHYEKVKEITKNIKNIFVFRIDIDFLKKNIDAFSRLEKEEEIIKSIEYKMKLGKRLYKNYPENTFAMYNLINHAKIDFVNLSFTLVDCDYAYWLDFGYFVGERVKKPDYLLDTCKFDLNCINYNIISIPEEKDKNILYTLIHSPERIGGFFFFGKKELLKEYQKLFHKNHISLQNMGIVDDDQHIALRCYFENPKLFCLHLTGWHDVLYLYQHK